MQQIDSKIKKAISDKVKEVIINELINQNLLKRLVEEGYFSVAKDDDRLDFSGLEVLPYGSSLKDNAITISGAAWGLHLMKKDKSGRNPSRAKWDGIKGKTGKIVVELNYIQEGLNSNLIVTVTELNLENPVEYEFIPRWNLGDWIKSW